MQPSLTISGGLSPSRGPGCALRAACNVQREARAVTGPCGLEPRVQFGERWFKEPGRRSCRPADVRNAGGSDERSGTHHRRGRRPAARPHRRPRAASACRRTTTGPDTDAFRNVAIAYGDDNPLWCDPAYGAGTRWGRSDRLAAAGRRRHADRRGRGRPRSTAELTDLMKGDPLRGVHAFYSASAREWWAPLYPDRRVIAAQRAGRRARQARASSPSRAVHEWTGQVFRDDDGPLLSAQYRLMIRTERTQGARAQEVRRHRVRAVHRRADRRDRRRSTRRRRRRGAEPRWWEDVSEGDERRPDGEGPAHRHRHDLLARRHGHGPLRRRARCGSARQNRARIPSFFHRDDLNVPDVHAARALGPRVRPPRRATRPRSTTAACARRGSSTSAPTGWATTPGCGSSTASSGCSTTSATRSGCGGTVTRKYLADGDRPAVDLELARDQPARRRHHAGPRDDPAAEPRARRGPAARSARRAPPTSSTRSTPSPMTSPRR